MEGIQDGFVIESSRKIWYIIDVIRHADAHIVKTGFDVV